MYLDFALAGVQTLLIGLKLTDLIDRSWWTVMLPTILWLVVSIIGSMMDKEEEK